MKPITSATMFMRDNLTDPVTRMGVRTNGKVFYRTVGGILYELDEVQIAILDRYGYRPRLTPELSGLNKAPPASDPFLKDTFADEWDRFCDADPTEDPEFIDKAEAAGLADLVPVDEDALQSAFAEERGIYPGGQMWILTVGGHERWKASAAARQKGGAK